MLKAACVLPLLLVAPIATGRPRTIILTVAAISAVVVVIIDLLAQRDIWVKVSPTGLSARSGSIPWWAIDEITVNDRGVVDTVTVRSFETLELRLPAPRNGPTGSNPRFHDEARLIVGNWQRYRQVRPADPLNLRATIERARELSEAEVIDLRPGSPPVIDLPALPADGDGTAAPAPASEPAATERLP